MSDSLVIASARRTPIGAFQGVLTPIKDGDELTLCRLVLNFKLPGSLPTR